MRHPVPWPVSNAFLPSRNNYSNKSHRGEKESERVREKSSGKILIFGSIDLNNSRVLSGDYDVYRLLILSLEGAKL